MRLTRQLTRQTRRDAWVEINLSHLEHNARLLRKNIPAYCQMMAVLKADAYGHGASMIIPTLEASGVSMLGVAVVDEGLDLRQTGVSLPILVLGASPDWAMRQAISANLTLTVFAQQHLDGLRHLSLESALKPAFPVPVHIKVDTGMHRIGVPREQAEDFVLHCLQQPYLKVEGIFTHLACGEDVQDPDGFTQIQLDRWEAFQGNLKASIAAQGLPLPRLWHVANSAGTSGLCQTNPDTLGNMVRLGLGFFGYESPSSSALGLRPVMGLKARIVHLQTLGPGEGISYGQRYHVPPDSPPRTIATLPLGYADGIPRTLSNRMKVVCHGILCPQVGSITMDQLMVDVTQSIETSTPSVGDAITLLGHDHGQVLTLLDWAGTLGTLEYELMCALRVRLPKTYIRD